MSYLNLESVMVSKNIGWYYVAFQLYFFIHYRLRLILDISRINFSPPKVLITNTKGQ